MGAREIHRDLEQWEMDAKALRRRMILAPTPREREVVRRLAAGPGLDGSGDGGGAGAGPTHHRPVGVGLRRGRACGPDIRQSGGSPPRLTRGSGRS